MEDSIEATDPSLASMVPSVYEPACPGCGLEGRPIHPVTIGALVAPDRRTRLAGTGGFHFCRTPSCDVVYFDPEHGDRIHRAELRVPVFQKDANPSRLVCYCFQHTVAGIEEEVRRTGASTVPDEIRDACRRGLDRCELENPQGVCCLANVRELVRLAAASHPASSASVTPPSGDAGQDCCGVRSVEGAEGSTARRRSPALAAGVAVVAAALSSACCWLPLLLIGMGISAVGIGAFFATFRSYLLVLTAFFLVGGFYVVYFRQPRCAPGAACEVPDRRLRRINRLTLWLTAVAVAALALFPRYGGGLLARAGGLPLSPTSSLVAVDRIRTYRIEGMTCEACVPSLRRTIEAVPAVASVAVSFERSEAVVGFTGEGVPDDAVIAAIRGAGYRALPASRPPD